MLVSQKHLPVLHTWELIRKGEVWNTLKRQVKKFQFLSQSESQDNSFGAHQDFPLLTHPRPTDGNDLSAYQ